MQQTILLVAVVLAVLSTPACNRQPAPKVAEPALSVPGPSFVVTVTPLELVLRELCGERAQVIPLLRPGANSHTFDPTPDDARAVAKATALLWVGPEYDGWAAEFEAKRSVPVLELVPAASRLELADHAEWGEPAETHTHEHEHDHAHDHHATPWDPHFLIDPSTVRTMLPALRDKLCELDPAGAALYAGRAEDFEAELAALDNELRTLLAPVRGEPVLMFHPSFNYFLRSYGLRSAGLIEPSPGKEPTPRYLQSIVDRIRRENIKAVFSETLLPSAPAAVISEAAGVPVVELDPACGNSGAKYRNYCEWVRHNARLIREALQ